MAGRSARMIELEGLMKRYGTVRAVDGIDLEVTRGQVVGLLGPNGAGKSTTIRMILGYLMPTAGRVMVDGLEVWRNLKEVRRRIGYLPESAPLYAEMRVGEFLKFRAKMFDVSRARRKRAIDLAVHRCWLQDVRRRTIAELSKGYRQRVGLAAALLHEPPLLILDEPTSGLDPDQIREVRGLLRELAERHTIVLSTHILPEAELTCDSIVMIARGRIRAAGTLQSLRQSAARTMRYVVETDSGKAASALSAVAGVASVDVSNIDARWKRLIVKARPDAADLREELSKALLHAGALVRELRQEAPTLEAIFVQKSAEAEAEFAREQEIDLRGAGAAA